METKHETFEQLANKPTNKTLELKTCQMTIEANKKNANSTSTTEYLKTQANFTWGEINKDLQKKIDTAIDKIKEIYADKLKKNSGDPDEARQITFKEHIQPIINPFKKHREVYDILKQLAFKHAPNRKLIKALLIESTLTECRRNQQKLSLTDTNRSSLQLKQPFNNQQYNQKNKPLNCFKYISSQYKIKTGEIFSNVNGQDFKDGAFIKRHDQGISPKFLIMLDKDFHHIHYPKEKQEKLRNYVLNKKEKIEPQEIYDYLINRLHIRLPLYMVKGDYKKNKFGLQQAPLDNIKNTNFVQSKPSILRKAVAYGFQFGKALSTNLDQCNIATLREGIAIELLHELGFNTPEHHFRIGSNNTILYANKFKPGLKTYTDLPNQNNNQSKATPKNLAQLHSIALLLGDWDKVGSRKQNILFEEIKNEETTYNELFVFDMDKSFGITKENKDKDLPHPFNIRISSKYSNFNILFDANNPSAYAETILKLYLMSGKKINKNIIKSYGKELEEWSKEEKDIHVFFKKVLEGLSTNKLTLKYKNELEQKIEIFKYRLNETIKIWEKTGAFKMEKKEYNVNFWERNKKTKHTYKELLKKLYSQNTRKKD